MSFDTLFVTYLDDLARRRVAASTLRNVRQALPCFFDFLRDAGVHDARGVRDEHIIGYGLRLISLRSRAGRPLSAGTRAFYIAVVKAFFGYLERRGTLLRNPAADVPLPPRRRLPRALSEAEARRLVSTPLLDSAKGKRDRALLELLYGTGLRMSECERLDITDVDVSRGTVLVRDGKGRKDRVVPLTGRAKQALAGYLCTVRPELARWSEDAALFLARTGRRLSAMSLRVLVREYGRRAGVKASCHVLRHSYATHLLAGGADIRHIQRLLGHAQLTTTALYAQVDSTALAAMLARSHPRERR